MDFFTTQHDRPVSGSSRLSLSRSASLAEGTITPPRTPSPSIIDPEPHLSTKTSYRYDHGSNSAPLPSIHIDNDVSSASEAEEVNKKIRGNSRRIKGENGRRTRTWAEEMHRSHSLQSRKPKAQEPYARSAWSVSSEVIDSLVKELNPRKYESPHLPTAASVIQANDRRSHRLSTSDDESVSSGLSDQILPPSPLTSTSRFRTKIESRSLDVPLDPGPSRRTSVKSTCTQKSSSILEPLLRPTSISPSSRPVLASAPSSLGNKSTSASPSGSEIRQISSPSSTSAIKSSFTILSIDDIIRKHSPAAADAEAAVKARAKKEIEAVGSLTQSKSSTSRRQPESHRLSASHLDRKEGTYKRVSNAGSQLELQHNARSKHREPDHSSSYRLTPNVARKVSTMGTRQHNEPIEGTSSMTRKPQKTLRSSSPHSPTPLDTRVDSKSGRMILDGREVALGTSVTSEQLEREKGSPQPLSPIDQTQHGSAYMSRTSTLPGQPNRTTLSLPTRTSSLPTSPPPSVPARTSSRFGKDAGDVFTKADESSSSLSGDSVSQGIQMSQALLDQLDHSSISSKSSSRRRISFQPPSVVNRTTISTPPRGAKLAKRKSLPVVPTTVSSPVIETEAQTYARYLRSIHLNRIISVPRPIPERPLHVSFAEVGNPAGKPVVVFLGLGCVRYLIALFDDIAKVFNLRLICIDRWGFGKTDNVPQEKRDVMSWARVIERALDQLGVESFQLLSHSAGTPYALASALHMQKRVRGKIHLLAPWVSADIDGGYKWLKWVPNGLIKSATAAEWRLQSYLLGKPPPLAPHRAGQSPRLNDDHNVSSSDTSDHQIKSEFASPSKTGRGIVRRASRILAPRSMDPIRDSPTRHQQMRKSTMPTSVSVKSRDASHLRAADELGTNDRANSPSLSSSNSYSILRDSSRDTLDDPMKPHHSISQAKGTEWSIDMIDGFEPLPVHLGAAQYEYPPARPSPMRYGSTPEAAAIDDRPRAPTGAAFTLALMQASHAECEPGTTGDLLSIVLNRSSTMPQGVSMSTTVNNDSNPIGNGNRNGIGMSTFAYTDITHPVKIWYGAEDDKVSEKSMRWMERCMPNAELIIMRGEGHGLMTSARVMWDVFESLGKDAKGFQAKSRI